MTSVVRIEADRLNDHDVIVETVALEDDIPCTVPALHKSVKPGESTTVQVWRGQRLRVREWHA